MNTKPSKGLDQPPSRVVQIQVASRSYGCVIFALCNDGSIWKQIDGDGEWFPVLDYKPEPVNINVQPQLSPVTDAFGTQRRKDELEQ